MCYFTFFIFIPFSLSHIFSISLLLCMTTSPNRGQWWWGHGAWQYIGRLNWIGSANYVIQTHKKYMMYTRLRVCHTIILSLFNQRLQVQLHQDELNFDYRIWLIIFLHLHPTKHDFYMGNNPNIYLLVGKEYLSEGERR